MAGFKVDVKLDMQGYYDNLILYRKCIDAQIEVLEEDVMICIHKDVKVIEDGQFKGDAFCNNRHCGKMVSSERGNTQARGINR